MYINDNLLIAYRNISSNCDDPNRVMSAMICATKDTIRTYECRCRCWLLNRLRKRGVGTNEVEYGVERLCKSMTPRGGKQTIDKIIILAYEEKNRN